MRFVISLGVITVVLVPLTAGNAGPPNEGGGQPGGKDQRPQVQGENPHRDDATLHHPKLEQAKQDAQFDKLHKGKQWPSNWNWRFYPGRGWYAPSGRYLAARPILEPIRIINPPENGVTLNYTVNGFRFSIPPGHTQELNDDRRWVIEFSQGAGFGPAKYALQPGRYHFASSPGGWELFGPEPPAAGPPGVPPTNPPPPAGVPLSLPAQGDQPPLPPSPSSPAQGTQPQPPSPSSPAQGTQPQPTGPSSPAQGTQPQPTGPSSPAQGTQPPALPAPGPF